MQEPRNTLAYNNMSNLHKNHENESIHDDEFYVLSVVNKQQLLTVQAYVISLNNTTLIFQLFISCGVCGAWQLVAVDA